MTHLRKIACEPCVGVLRRQPPKIAIRRPAPRSQGCEVRTPSVLFDTGERAKCPQSKESERGDLTQRTLRMRAEVAEKTMCDVKRIVKFGSSGPPAKHK